MRGEVVAIIGSGPSLTKDDVEAVRHLKVITVNSSWKIAPWCDVLFAGDWVWWKNYGKEVHIDAKKVCMTSRAKEIGAIHFKTKFKNGYNSGLGAIEYALHREARKIILLGFDCSIENGTHWHGDHKKTPNPNIARCNRWKTQFDELRTRHKDADIVNCSRYTEIKAFPVKDLAEVLCELS